MFRTLVVTITLVILPVTALAQKSGPPACGPWITTVDLITIGPGEHLFSRMGHSALLVFKFRKDSKRCLAEAKKLAAQAKADPTRAQALAEQAAALIKAGKEYSATVYNYGDADFDAGDFEWKFLRGTVKFFLSKTESLPGFIELYARSNRSMTHRRLNLSSAQVAKVAAALDENVKPQNREYPYHHMEAGCATKIRDLLDRELGGIIRKQFQGKPHPLTARGIGRKHLAGHPGAEIFSDLFMGRLHDRPFDKFYAMFHPLALEEYLQQVMVPDPSGSGAKVPLLDAKVSTFLTRRCGPTGEGAAAKDAGPKPDCSPMRGEGRTLVHLAYLLMAILLGVGIWAFLGQPGQPMRAGVWLLIWSLPMSIASLAMVVGALASTVSEGRVNELMLAFPVTDLILVGVGFRWYLGRGHAGKLLRGYALVRLAMVALALILHALGVFYQEPRAMVFLALLCTAGLMAFTRRFPLEPQKDAEEESDDD